MTKRNWLGFLLLLGPIILVFVLTTCTRWQELTRIEFKYWLLGTALAVVIISVIAFWTKTVLKLLE